MTNQSVRTHIADFTHYMDQDKIKAAIGKD